MNAANTNFGETPWGMTQGVKAIDDKFWEIIEKTNGKMSATSN